MGALTFNHLLQLEGIAPAEVRLLRHETLHNGKTPYGLWRQETAAFDNYQRVQKSSRRAYFASPIWASFVVGLERETLFAGLFSAQLSGTVPRDWNDPMFGTQDWSGCDLYDTARLPELTDYVGKLVIDWGKGTRTWTQRADVQAKPVLELRATSAERPFPGFARFCEQLSNIASLPFAWQTALTNTRGVYLLTCPRTKEQYVGSACGNDGFWGRWMNYVESGHGGNVGLMSREPADYRVSILQVAGTGETTDDILDLEKLWKIKLQSREMGLNRN